MDEINGKSDAETRNSEKKESELENSEISESDDFESETPDPDETASAEPSEPETSVPEPAESESLESETTAPEPADPESSEPESSEPVIVAPESSTPETAASETTESESSESVIAATESSTPETSASEATESEPSEPVTAASETTDPESSEPETVAPDATDPEPAAPESSELESSEPVIAESETAVSDEGTVAKKSKKKSKKGLIVSLILLCFLMIIIGAIYIGGVVYFQERFFFNTQVNGVDFSRQTTADAREFVESKANDYYIMIIGEDEENETIYASEVDLRFEASGVIEELFNAQNPFRWPLSLLNSQETYAGFDSFFDEELLSERVANLKIVTEGQTSPVSADVIMEDNEVVIVPHQYGDIVDVEALNELVQEHVSILAYEFNAIEADIFFQPELTIESSEIVDTFELANNYLSAEITYVVGSETIVDRDLIADWVSIDDFNVNLDEDQISEWLNNFIGNVNTLGTTRELTTPEGRNVTVSGGYYGWVVARDLEFSELVDNIRNGEVIEREPIFSQRASAHEAHDWGDTFLQVDLTEQHMWAFINGEMVFESPVVTGRPPEFNTPEGVYFILEMLSPNVLISPWLDDDGEPTYETHVYYWMRTTWSGHGFHDAPWQETFGGDHYQEYGSHGCTNLPLEAARELYGLIHHMMPVVVHY